MTWSNQGTDLYQNVNKIKYENGRWIISGSIDPINKVYYSENGETWIKSYESVDNSLVTFNTLDYFPGKNIWMFGNRLRSENNKSLIIYSTDNGESWSNASIPTSYPIGSDISGIAYNNGKFVAGGSFLADEKLNSILLSSSDGITWEDIDNELDIVISVSYL